MVQRLNAKNWTIKIPKEITGQLFLYCPSLEMVFNYDAKFRRHKRLNMFACIKIIFKNFCLTKTTISKIKKKKRQTGRWEYFKLK